ncbi:MAG: ExeM/NucH family extracellular endonuclease [Flavobacteriales bacterium]|nr:ExeM/NucH family extracellular endonuclease [Flavobacteriales bacterium]
MRIISVVLSILHLFSLRGQTPICAIQGTSNASPFAGQVVTTTGIMTAVFSGSGTVQGFFLEEPGCDADTQSSNGLFVYYPGSAGLSQGQRVIVNGTVVEFNGLTELSQVTSVNVVGSGVVDPTPVSLPVQSLTDWERYEGMLLRFPQEMVVTGNEDWAQYGELTLAPGRLFQPTDSIDPNDDPPSGTSSSGMSNVASVTNASAVAARSEIILDDGRTSTYPTPPPLIGPEGTLRCGSTVTDLVAVLHYAYGNYRLHPAGTVPLQHAQRPSAPGASGGLRIAGLNVLNFFTTLGSNGAGNSSELLRQRTKLVAALSALDADALVLCELENNDDASNELLAALNQSVVDDYAVIDHDASGSFTRSVIYYRPSTLTPITDLMVLNTSTFERAHLTQGFQANGTGKRFLLSTAHLRSKLCDNASGTNVDMGDGQGCFNARRKAQASELVNHWASLRAANWIPSQLILGDFNSYTEEDPIDRLRAGGLEVLNSGSSQEHTYAYGNRFGSLDHMIATSEMATAVISSMAWNINSDEPSNLDYHDWNAAFYQPDAFRSSDHDPVLVDVDPSMIPTSIPLGTLSIPIRFNYDPDQRLASWQGEGSLTVEVFDPLGRLIWSDRRADRASYAVPEGVSGAMVWRCTARAGLSPACGRFFTP